MEEPKKGDELATAILNKKDKPNRLLVEDAVNNDNSVVALSLAKMDELQCSGATRSCSRARRGRRVSASYSVGREDPDEPRGPQQPPAPSRRRGGRPVDDTVEGLTGNWFEVFLKPYFLEAYRPIHNGDTFIVRGGMRAVEFSVVGSIPLLHRGSGHRHSLRGGGNF